MECGILWNIRRQEFHINLKNLRDYKHYYEKSLNSFLHESFPINK